MRRTAALQLAWLSLQAPAWRRFRRARSRVQRTVEERLAALTRTLGPSHYGRHVGLDRVRSPSDFQRRVPVLTSDEAQPWVDRITKGERGVLTTEPVRMLERTSGSSGASKLIPYTDRLRREFSESLAAWMVDLHRRNRGLIGTRSYWSISRATRTSERTLGGLQVGFDSDAEYFSPVEQWAIARMMAVPGSVARAPDMHTWRMQTCEHLLAAADLGLISVWSPTFLSRLMQFMTVHRNELADRVPSARHRLAHAYDGERLRGSVLWPRLGVISAWGDGFAERLLPEMMRSFPSVSHQPKGVLATEGVLSIPFGVGEGSVLAVCSHVIELRDVQSERVRWPHEAALGGLYQPLLTTGGGLVRYALPDVVRVVGFEGQIPRIRLQGRLDKGSDLVGEKLTSAFVATALSPILPPHGTFATLVPTSDPLGYVLVSDVAIDESMVEAALCESYHYRYARDLEQIAAVRVRVVSDAWTRWEHGIDALGLTLGEQKPSMVEGRRQLVSVLLSRG